jgi:hypothetical protein
VDNLRGTRVYRRPIIEFGKPSTSHFHESTHNAYPSHHLPHSLGHAEHANANSHDTGADAGDERTRQSREAARRKSGREGEAIQRLREDEITVERRDTSAGAIAEDRAGRARPIHLPLDRA